MGRVVFDISMSLDGFVRSADPTPEEPLGVGGERLHEWLFDGGDEDRAYFSGYAALMLLRNVST